MWGNAEDRGQSVVLGAILVFAFLIVGLAGVQTFIVPQQNEQVELNHQTVVDDDFTRLHSGLMNAAEQGENYTASIRLGTRYPSRAFTLNAPDPSGSLRTQDIGEYNRDIPGRSDPLADLCGISGQTQALEYRPNYNHLSGVGTHGYENTVQFQAVGDNLAELNSNFVSGDTIRLRPLVGGSLGTTSTGSVSTDFYAGTTGKTPNKIPFDSSTVLRLPTTLSQGQWDRIVAKESEITTASVNPAVGEVKIGLQTDDYNIQCTPIGVGGPPENSPSSSFTSSDDTDTDESNSAAINPIGEGALELDSVSGGSCGMGGGGNTLCASFSNNASESRTVTEVRIPYGARPGNSVDSIEVNGEQIDVGEGYEDIPNITWGAGATQDIEFGDVNNNVASFGMVVRFKNGETATYFVAENN